MRGRNGDGDEAADDDCDNTSQSPPSSMCAERYQQPSTNAPDTAPDPSLTEIGVPNGADDSSANNVEMTVKTNGVTPEPDKNAAAESQTTTVGTGTIPFAIAKLYRLPLVSSPSFVGPSPARKSQSNRTSQNSNISTSPLLSPDSTDEEQVTPVVDNDVSSDPDSSQYIIPDEEFTPSQLRTLVQAVFPKNGAKIVKQPRRALPGDNHDRYGIIGSDGSLKRVLFVEKNGKVFEELDDDDDSEGGGRFSNTIKLGLGDFIFYSVLVAKSAQYSFTCFVSSFLVVLAGLGGTLVLLAVYKHALPALPISIALAVVFYVFTRFIIQPYVEAIMITPFYV